MFFRNKFYYGLFSALIISTATVADESVVELDDVIVTAPITQKISEFVTPVTVLSDEELRLKVGHSIGETLKNELGITSQSFGPGVGTPIIRGQSGSRVKVLNNGVGSNDVSAIDRKSVV